MDYDFSGWATRNNIECSDGRTIMKDAFKDNDGQKFHWFGIINTMTLMKF